MGARLEQFSMAWDVLEGVVVATAGAISGSITLMGFGQESVIETIAAGTLYWRLRKELPITAGKSRTPGTLRRCGRVPAAGRQIDHVRCRPYVSR